MEVFCFVYFQNVPKMIFDDSIETMVLMIVVRKVNPFPIDIVCIVVVVFAERVVFLLLLNFSFFRDCHLRSFHLRFLIYWTLPMML